MTCREWLEIAANISSIVTAVLAGIFAVRYWLWKYRKQRNLEDYLKNEKLKSKDKGQRSIMHLVAKLGLTEAEILNASFRSRYIARRISSDKDTNLATAILLEYSEAKNLLKTVF